MSYNDPATDPQAIYDVSCILCGKAYKIYKKALAARDLAYNDATANFGEAEDIYLAAYAALNNSTRHEGRRIDEQHRTSDRPADDIRHTLYPVRKGLRQALIDTQRRRYVVPV